MQNTIALQGQVASFHDMAARQVYGSDIRIKSCDTFREVFEAVAQGQASRGLVAMENSLVGSINEVYDLLLEYRLPITGEVYLRIEQCLLGIPGSQIQTITEVHSHPVALLQCTDFLDAHLTKAERLEHADTAGSAADVKKWNNPHKAAIASSAAATLHGLDILARDIETHSENYTRFVGLSGLQTGSANKTSLVITTDHTPGALYRALGSFDKQNINLTKLQSRPIIGQAWHYMFYVDVAAGINESGLKNALQELDTQKCEVTILGTYVSGMLDTLS